MIFLVAFAASLLATAITHAQLIAYDDAAYAPVNSLSVANGGSGWNGPWTGANRVVAGGLDFAGLLVTSNRFVTAGNNVASFRFPNLAGFESFADGSRFGRDGTTLWLSFLVRRDATAAGSYAGVSLFDGGTEELFIGQPFEQTRWGIHVWDVGNPGGITLSANNVVNGQIVFFAMRLRFGTSGVNDTVDLFMNPTPGVEPTVPAATRSGANIHFDRLRIASGNLGTIISVDELRLGTTYASVAPVSLSLSISDATAIEPATGTTNAEFNVRLNLPTTNEVRVAFATTNGTARAEEDFITTNGTLIFAPNQTNAVIRIPVRGDGLPEGSETFTVTLSNPQGAALVRATATDTILDPPSPLLAYDGVDYAPVESNTGNFNGGVGFGGRWLGNVRVLAGSLGFDGLVTSGNRFATVDTTSVASLVRPPNANSFPALTESGEFGRDGTEVWLSFLIRRERRFGSFSHFGVLLKQIKRTAFEVEDVLFIGTMIGLRTVEDRWGLFDGLSMNPGPISLTSTSVGTNTTAFLVVRLRFQTPPAPDVAELWINPSIGATPGSPNASLNLPASRNRFSSIELSTDNSFGSWDEFRLGSTFSAVAPSSGPPPPTLRTDSLQIGNGKVTFKIETVAGASYTLQFKAELSESEWRDAATVTGDGSETQLTDAQANGPTGFYRLRVTAP